MERTECVNFRKLNRLTVFDHTPIPTAEEIFQKMAKGKYLTKLPEQGLLADPSSGQRYSQDSFCHA